MNELKRNRLLIPDNKIIVVLDTAPVRGLAYVTETPPWVDTFARMAQQNYSFSLADGALSELLAQRQRNALSPADCQKNFGEAAELPELTSSCPTWEEGPVRHVAS